MSFRVSRQLNSGDYFITITIVHWYNILNTFKRYKILAKSIQYCQRHKGLKVEGYVFMPNHIHLLIYSPDVSGFLRDFKRHTTRELKKNIEHSEPTKLKLFYNKDSKFQIWKSCNSPKFVETYYFFIQKLEYIHNNPVEKNYVEAPEDWYWSSANERSPTVVDRSDW